MHLVDENGHTPGAPALVLPARDRDADQPALRTVRAELLGAGRRVLTLCWDGPAPTPEQVPEFVRVLFADLRPGLVVAGSLTTLALPVAAEHGLPGIWLTPLLDHPDAALAAARSDAWALLVGGTADPSWNSGLAHETGREVFEIKGADHSLECPGDPVATAAGLAGLAGRVREYVRC